jgi:hypothetical protein
LVETSHSKYLLIKYLLAGGSLVLIESMMEMNAGPSSVAAANTSFG